MFNELRKLIGLLLMRFTLFVLPASTEKDLFCKAVKKISIETLKKGGKN